MTPTSRSTSSLVAPRDSEEIAPPADGWKRTANQPIDGQGGMGGTRMEVENIRATENTDDDFDGDKLLQVGK